MSSYKCCQPDTKEFKQAESIASLLQLIGEPNRLKLLCLLGQSSHCVCEIMSHFDMSQSLISHHLADLRDAKLVQNQKNGRQVIYSLTERGRQVSKNIFAL